MRTIKVKGVSKYKVIIDGGAIRCLSFLVQKKDKVVIITSENIANLYLDRVKKEIEKFNPNVITFFVPDGEYCKNKQTIDDIIEFYSKNEINKNSLVIALGGGTVSDIVGFSCAIYKRGIPYVNIPTTILSMADACIGGKTAIDYNGVKNLIGTFYSPKCVIIDTDFISTLSAEEIKDGYAEIIKCGIIGDKKAFRLAEKKELSIINGIISALKVKAKIVGIDEFENNERRLLNLGHTFAHAIESYNNFSISHGRAVAIGIIFSAEISYKLGLSKNLKEKFIKVFNNYNIDLKVELDREKMYNFMLSDKKRKGDEIALVLPVRVGKCKIVLLSTQKLKELIYGC